MNGRIKALMALPEMKGWTACWFPAMKTCVFERVYQWKMLFTKDERLLFTDSRYSEQAQTHPAFTVVETGLG
ncbi:MAG: hypothetical protein ACLT0Y_07945 [Christensenellales bacterium]